MQTRMFVATLAIAATLACGRPAEEPATEVSPAAGQSGAPQAQPGADEMTKGLQQMAQGLQQMAQAANDGTAVTPVALETLETALPAVSGWTRGEPEGHSMSMPMAMSNTEATYTKDDMEVTLTITDSALSPLLAAPLAMVTAAGYSERTSTGFKRSTTIGGVPAYEEWDSESKRGNVGAIVAKRFIVEASGSGLDRLETLKAFIGNVDFTRLAALK